MTELEPWMLAKLREDLVQAAEELASWLPLENASAFRFGDPIDGGVTPAQLVAEGGGVCLVAPFGGRMTGRIMVGLGPQLATRASGGDSGELDPSSTMDPVLHSVAESLNGLMGGPVRISEITIAPSPSDGFAWTGNGSVVGVPLYDGENHVATLALEFQVILVVGETPTPEDLARVSVSTSSPANEPAEVVPTAAFESFVMGSLADHISRPLDLLHDVELAVTAELGRTRMSVRDLLSLAPGSVVELDRAAGAPIDVLVNGTLIARGEVVVIDEEFGIRITEIISADNPIAKKLNH